MLTFKISPEVPHWILTNILKQIFLETIWSIELKFDKKSSNENLFKWFWSHNQNGRYAHT